MRLFVADGHGLTRAGVRWAVERDEDFEVVGEAKSGAQALARISQSSPDVVLLDTSLSGMDVLTCLTRIRRNHPRVSVIVLTDQASQFVATVCAHGASGVIVKSIDALDLCGAIRQILEGAIFTPVGNATPTDHPADAAGLTRREREVLVAVGMGLSNKEISRRSWVTEQTVKFHLTNVYRKLGLTNRTAAARWAHQHGVVSLASGEDPAESTTWSQQLKMVSGL
jgi:DNA-binding NarL/FixJ family response regulator